MKSSIAFQKGGSQGNSREEITVSPKDRKIVTRIVQELQQEGIENCSKKKFEKRFRERRRTN